MLMESDTAPYIMVLGSHWNRQDGEGLLQDGSGGMLVLMHVIIRMEQTVKRWRDGRYSGPVGSLETLLFFSIAMFLASIKTFQFHLELLNFCSLYVNWKLNVAFSFFFSLCNTLLYWYHIGIGNTTVGFTHYYNGKKIISFPLCRSREETAQQRLFRIIPEQTAEKWSNQSFKEKLALQTS